jgi:TPR repeat protein
MDTFEPKFQLPDGLSRVMVGAEAGIGYAAWMLANKYLVGTEVEKDIDKAVFWFLEGAKRGCHLCQRGYAWCIESGKVPNAPSSEIVRWRKSAADKGDGSSQFLLGEMYLHGRLVPHDSQRARRYLQLAADAKVQDAERLLAIWLALDEAPPESPGATYLMLKRRWCQGDPKAAYALSLCHSTQWGMQSPCGELARAFLNDAANAGYPPAIRDLAISLGGEANYDKWPIQSINLLHRAAAAGDGMGMAILGSYYAGTEVRQMDISTSWFKQSVDADFSGAYAYWARAQALGGINELGAFPALSLARWSLAKGYYHARTVVSEVASTYFSELSHLPEICDLLVHGIYASDTTNIPFLARLYQDQKQEHPHLSIRDKLSEDILLFWLQAAVEEFDTQAMYYLARELMRPEKTRYDPASGLALLSSGAFLGDDVCATMLAYYFTDGTSLIRNTYASATMNTKAAMSGNVDAMHNLAVQYHYGDGVPMDRKISDYWNHKRIERLGELGSAVEESEEDRLQRRKPCKIIKFPSGCQ